MERESRTLLFRDNRQKQVRRVLFVPVNLMHGGSAATDMGMIMENHIRVPAVLHAVDLQLNPVSGFKHVSQGEQLYRILINLLWNSRLRAGMGMPGGIRP